MKYLTKEWYELCQKTSFHLGLEEEKQAETFSQQFFQQLYNTELNNWLNLQEEVASLMKNNETVNTNDNIEYEPFNRDIAIEQFHEGFIYNQELLKKELPETILKQIADIRVFTLNKATRTVINAVAKFCEDNERSVTATSENYRRYLEEASDTLDKEIIGNFGFHDCTITKSVQKDMSLTLLLDNSGGFTNIDEVTFKNFKIIKQEGSLEDSWWLYEEVYKVNDEYEFHVLFHNNKMGLTDFIISAEYVSFKESC
ncbi:DUF4085 family protein [Paenibacillus arenilitoris]|uniref:DUF4085 family protein n=1 Tax=Paenibacillus arenilitoris TaxID=2772299 RepID=A0A927H9V4_9BACL|nr:DUF4085 family protein [Paenibacillus arenilitoris]MBD2871999.1 DUF4085 family protein [Paenibacillus arenilitoris]